MCTVYIRDAICGQEFNRPAGNFNNIKCFACLDNLAMKHGTIRPNTFEEAEFSTLPVQGGVLKQHGVDSMME